MPQDFLSELFSLEGKVAVVTGGMGVLASSMVDGLAKAGAKVGILSRARREAEVEQRAAALESAGHPAMALFADVLDKPQLLAAHDAVLARWGRVDILVNAAGGNKPEATVFEDMSFADVSQAALDEVFDLNLMGTILPCQVFGAAMAVQHEGSIVNISSMAASRAMTRVIGYGAAKAAVENFTRWLAIDMAKKYGAGLRVNAMAPGFFVGEQNRRLLLNEDNSLTPRGQTIIDHTAAGRFGEPHELVATLIWLCSPGASFITGTVIPVDGGFSAFSGV